MFLLPVCSEQMLHVLGCALAFCVHTAHIWAPSEALTEFSHSKLSTAAFQSWWRVLSTSSTKPWLCWCCEMAFSCRRVENKDLPWMQSESVPAPLRASSESLSPNENSKLSPISHGIAWGHLLARKDWVWLKWSLYLLEWLFSDVPVSKANTSLKHTRAIVML